MILYHLMVLFSIEFFGSWGWGCISFATLSNILYEKSQSRKNIVEKYNKACVSLPIVGSLQIIISLPSQI